MRRRDLVALVAGGAITWSLTAPAEEPTKVARIGFLGLAPAAASASRVEALQTGLRELGWIEGKNILIEFRWAQRIDQLPDLAAELVRMEVDIIFAPSSTFVPSFSECGLIRHRERVGPPTEQTQADRRRVHGQILRVSVSARRIRVWVRDL